MLRRLTDSEYNEASERAAMSGVALDQCPTCGSEVKPTSDPTTWERRFGTYKYRGQVWDCNCDDQMELRKHYLLANIGDQFQRLDWKDFDGAQVVQDNVAVYLDKWPGLKRNGMGIEFTGPTLGTGKTFAATHIAKELVKRGEKIFFQDFRDVISGYKRSDAEAFEKRLKGVTVLVLDEVIGPSSDAQGALFSEKFEELIRHRTNYNLPTIMTTNLTPHKLGTRYPRPYSLLEAKQIRVLVEGEDARTGWIGDENMVLIANDEVRPIT